MEVYAELVVRDVIQEVRETVNVDKLDVSVLLSVSVWEEVGALERWCVCRGDQPININVVVKVGGTYPPVPPVAAPLGREYTRR